MIINHFCSHTQENARITVTVKLFLKINHKKICKKLEENISNTQFGLSDKLGIRDALFGIFSSTVPFECHIDIEKIFDKVTN